MTWETLDWTILDRLRDGFISGEAAHGPYWRSAEDLRHYDLTYAERIGWKWDHMLTELQQRGWSPPRGPMLDYGCGSGIAARRVLDRWPDAIPAGAALHLCDHSPLAEAYAMRRATETHPALAVQTWDRTVVPTTLVISHVLNELDADGADELGQRVAQSECVLWVEPGTSAVAAQLVAWRERLRDRFQVVYPCPHQGACGLLAAGNERHWCHHFAKPPGAIFADGQWVRFGQRAGIDLRSLPYSALVLERRARPESAALPPDAGRVIGRPEVFKPYARLLGCDAGGVQPLTMPKRIAPRLWKRFDRTEAPRLFVWQHDRATLTALDPWPPATPGSNWETSV